MSRSACLKEAEDLSRKVGLETAPNFAVSSALGAAPLDVGAGWLVVEHPAERHEVQRPVQTSVALAVEPVANGLSRRGRYRADAGQHRRGPVFGVRPGEHHIVRTEKLFPRVVQLLREQGAEDVFVFGGGIIPKDDIPKLKERGIEEIFTPGAPTSTIVSWLRARLAKKAS